MRNDKWEYQLTQDAGQPRRRKRRGLLITAIALACLCLAVAVGLGAGTLVRALEGVRVVRKDQAASLRPGTIPGYVLAETMPAMEGDILSATEIYDRLCASCVGVTTPMTTQNAFGQTTSAAITGSGFIISPDGYIVTNYHVIETALKEDLSLQVMLYDGQSYQAQIVGGDDENDVALLKIDGKGLPSVVLGDFESTRVGETVYAIGNPLGELAYTMTSGIVSALDRSIATESNLAINMFQIDAAINTGNSGGPVVNDRGQVIGIASAKLVSSGVEGLGFAIPIDDARKVVDDLAQYGYVRGRVLLGITVTSASYYGYSQAGALVVSVTPGGCSEKAGLLEGDVITAANDQEIAGSPALITAKKGWSPGQTVVLTVFREGDYLELSVLLDEKLPEKAAGAYNFGDR